MKIATLVLFSVMMMAPSPTLFSAPFQKDKPAEVDRAEQSLHTAKGELEKAGTEWGGHRVAAIKHIDAALKELEQAEAWARGITRSSEVLRPTKWEHASDVPEALRGL